LVQGLGAAVDQKRQEWTGKQKEVGFAKAFGSDHMVFICSVFSCDMTQRGVCGSVDFAAISAVAALNACVE